MEKLKQIYNDLHDLGVKHGQLEWVLYTAGYDFGIEETYEKLVGILKNTEYFNHIKKLKDKNVGDDKAKREVEIVFNAFKSYHLSDELNELDLKIQKQVNDLSKILNTFRYTFEGKKVSTVDLQQVLSGDDNRARRKEAYFAYSQINQDMIDGGFIELIKLRKEYAIKAGFDNFIEYKLAEDELDKTTFDSWKDDLHKILPNMKEIRRQYAQEFLNDDVIYPWDEAYIQAKIAPSLNLSVDMSVYYDNLKEFFELFGFDISEYNITYDIFPRANKSEWGYNFPIETAKDSRILANVKNKYHEYDVLLHETGHALHSFLLDPEEKILNDGVSGIISEGIANLFQGFLGNKIFFEKFFLNVEEVEKEFKKLQEYQKITSLRAVNNIFFEHSLYKNEVNSLEDIYNLYWINYEELFKEKPFAYEIPWANRIHYTTHPIYLHNYFMGDVTCEMLGKVFTEKYGKANSELPLEFGKFLVEEVIKPSGMYKYNDLFKRISKETFSLKYMFD